MQKVKLTTLIAKKKIFFLCSLLITIILAIIWLLSLIKQHFPLKEIIFTGNHYLSYNDLYNLSKVKINEPLFWISTEKIYKNLISSSWIKDVKIKKDLNGKLIIQITEATAVAILHNAKRNYLIDKAGTILEEIPENQFLFLPVIKDIDPMKDKDTFTEAILLLNTLKDKSTIPLSDHIEIIGKYPEDLAVRTQEMTIKFGAGNFEEKLDKLEKIKEEIKNKYSSIESIDLRFTDQVIVKPRN
ncbi:MAG: FtsQ-type POTRA domain-containing protein [Thermodesulfovibrionales bacterium]|nr:FtsQ-type POTRA domain-containing protein [Thermodesulfovibrionales bacterium]